MNPGPNNGCLKILAMLLNYSKDDRGVIKLRPHITFKIPRPRTGRLVHSYLFNSAKEGFGEKDLLCHLIFKDDFDKKIDFDVREYNFSKDLKSKYSYIKKSCNEYGLHPIVPFSFPLNVKSIEISVVKWRKETDVLLESISILYPMTSLDYNGEVLQQAEIIKVEGS